MHHALIKAKAKAPEQIHPLLRNNLKVTLKTEGQQNEGKTKQTDKIRRPKRHIQNFAGVGFIGVGLSWAKPGPNKRPN